MFQPKLPLNQVADGSGLGSGLSCHRYQDWDFGAAATDR